MPVDSVHSEYQAHEDEWRTLRDVMRGDRAIKQAGVRYVSRLEGQSDPEYRAYVERGFFYNATSRTVSGFLGMIFRREPVTKLPSKETPLGKAMASFSDDCDMRGKDVAGYAREVVSEVTVIGRAGTLIDWAEGDENRAYWALYRAEDILNWREERINGRMQVTLVVLRETTDTDTGDGFTSKKQEKLRVLKLAMGINGASGDYSYCVEIWGREASGSNSKQDGFALIETVVPLRRGKPLPNIPFVFHGPNVSGSSVESSPISDIVAANLDHYRMNVDYKHGMHYTALPTAWVAGFDRDSVLRIGASTAWVTETLGATAGYLEFRGEGLKTFERAMDRNERLLAVLGARLLESQKRVSESAEALQIRQAGDSSVIASLAVAVSKSITAALRWVYWWHSTEEHPDQVSGETVLLELNRDFDIVRLSGKEIQALVMAWQSMAISQETLLHQFERGDVLPPGRSPEEELALIKANPPPVVSAPGTTSMDRGEGGYG